MSTERSRTCKRCDHSAEKRNPHVDGNLECRRHPPEDGFVGYTESGGSFVPITTPIHPEVPPDHWCGEWKQKEL